MGSVHVQRMDHRIDWDKANITATEQFYWKRRIQEALQIQSHPTTMSLDCGLSLSHFWLITVDQAILNNLSSVYLIFNLHPLLSFHPFFVFNLFKGLYHTYFSVVPY